MHYCFRLFTKEFPTEEVIENAMAPYYEEDWYNQFEYDEEEEIRIIPEDTIRPPFLWDWYQVGGRYSGELKLDVTNNEGDKKWGYYQNRVGIFYRSKLMESLRVGKTFFWEDDYYMELGYRDGYLRVDGAKISDLIPGNIDAPDCYGMICSDGSAQVREFWNGKTFIRNDEDFESFYADYIKTHSDEYIVTIDIHD